MPWVSQKVEINDEQRAVLTEIVESSEKSAQEKIRAQIVLLLANGEKNKDIAEQLHVHENTVVKWRGRWACAADQVELIDALDVNGRPRSVLTGAMMEAVKEMAVSAPPVGRVRWTVRSLALELELPIATLQRALTELGIELLKKDGDVVKETVHGCESSPVLHIPAQLFEHEV